MSTPLRTLVTDLLFDEHARTAFAEDPATYLDRHGWGDLAGPEVGAALVALVDELPVAAAARLHPVAADAADLPADLTGAIAGLRAAAASVDDLDVDAAASDDPAASLDAPIDDDPAAGIDGEPAADADPPRGVSGDEPADDEPAADETSGTEAWSAGPGTGPAGSAEDAWADVDAGGFDDEPPPLLLPDPADGAAEPLFADDVVDGFDDLRPEPGDSDG